jgi:hypothetical protein
LSFQTANFCQNGSKKHFSVPKKAMMMKMLECNYQGTKFAHNIMILNEILFSKYDEMTFRFDAGIDAKN